VKSPAKSCVVYIVGSGPGHKDLLTIMGYKVLKKAEVLIYDYLIPNEIIDIAPSDCIKIPHQKGETAEQRQKKFEDAVLNYCKTKKVIVRLQIGDPFLFGRGDEEIKFLRKNKIKFRVIPGVTSAIGVPTYVGLPVTSRGISSSVTIINGHPLKEGEINWEALKNVGGTIVIMMGISNSEKISSELIKNGFDPETPVCVISNGTTKYQRVLLTDLINMPSEIKKNKISPPGIIIVGKVVKEFMT
jgi:uroporphyrin-III C-methyltransferase